VFVGVGRKRIGKRRRLQTDTCIWAARRGCFTGKFPVAPESLETVKYTRAVFDVVSDFDSVSCSCVSQRLRR
jgi:hypothetical protein